MMKGGAQSAQGGQGMPRAPQATQNTQNTQEEEGQALEQDVFKKKIYISQA